MSSLKNAWRFICIVTPALLFLSWGLTAAYLFYLWQKELGVGPSQVELIWLLTRTVIVLTGLLLIYVIFGAKFTLRKMSNEEGLDPSELEENRKHRRIIQMSLVGGFAIATPALAITILGLTLAFPHFYETLRVPEPGIAGLSRTEQAIKNQRVTLDDLRTSSASSYVFGFDVSRSALDSTSDSQFSAVHDFMTLLMERHSQFGDLVHHRDTVQLCAFARQKECFYKYSGGTGETSKYLADDKFESEIPAFMRPDSALDVTKTDVLGFLESILDQFAVNNERAWCRVIVIVSDFMQDDSGGSRETSRERIAGIMGKVNDLGNVFILGVRLKHRPSVAGVTGEDLVPYLDDYIASGLWRSTDLSDFVKADDGLKVSMLIFGIFPERLHSETLVLKYQVAPTWTPLSTGMAIPQSPDQGKILLVLRKAPEVTEKISIAFGEKTNEFTISDRSMRDRYETLTPGSWLNPLPVTLGGELGSSRSVESDLLVGIPSRSIVHRIRVLVVPFLGNLPLEILRWALGFVLGTIILLTAGGIGVDELARLWRYRRKLLPDNSVDEG